MFSKANDFYLRPNFSSIVCASSKAGKTELVRDLIKQWTHVVPESTISMVSFVYESWQPCYDEIIASLPENVIVETHVGVPQSNDSLPTPDEVETNQYLGHPNRPLCRLGSTVHGDDECHILVLDDILNGQTKNTFLTQLFSVFAHHYKISTFLIVQQLYNNTALNRSLTANVEHILLLRSAVASGTLRALQNQYFSGQPQYLSSAYRKIVARGGNYIHIDLTSLCNDNRRVKSGLLKEEVSAGLEKQYALL